MARMSLYKLVLLFVMASAAAGAATAARAVPPPPTTDVHQAVPSPPPPAPTSDDDGRSREVRHAIPPPPPPPPPTAPPQSHRHRVAVALKIVAAAAVVALVVTTAVCYWLRCRRRRSPCAAPKWSWRCDQSLFATLVLSIPKSSHPAHRRPSPDPARARERRHPLEPPSLQPRRRWMGRLRASCRRRNRSWLGQRILLPSTTSPIHAGVGDVGLSGAAHSRRRGRPAPSFSFSACASADPQARYCEESPLLLENAGMVLGSVRTTRELHPLIRQHPCKATMMGWAQRLLLC